MNEKHKDFLKKRILQCIFVVSILGVGCVPKSKLAVSFKKNKINEPLSISVSHVRVLNHQIIITGTNLNTVTSFKIKEGSNNANLQIESRNDTSIVANTISNVTFAAGRVFDFILSDASASATFTVNFSLCDSSLGGKGFNCSITPNDKEVLSYDAASGKWKPRAVNGLAYLGAWDASGGANPGAKPTGYYYIVGVAGNIGGAYSVDVGDWVVSNGTAWQKIDNSTAIVNVFGRTGAISAAEGDYDLTELSDVTITAPSTNQVLKYNGTAWVNSTATYTETDPSVIAFAKSALPTCGAGQVLKSNGLVFSCVTDNVGTSFTGTANRVIVSDGVGALAVSAITDTVLGYLSGTTSNIQTQINNKLNSSSFVDWSSFGTVPTINPSRINLTTANRVVVTGASGSVAASTTTTTELGYLTGVTSSIQTQLNSKLTSYTETDPGVSAFAKAALPTCGAGEVLKSNGTNFSCVTDSAGAGSYTGTQNRLVLTDGTTGALTTSAVTNTEAGYLSGVTSAIQTQLSGKQATIDRTTVQPVSALRVYGANTTNYVELSVPALAGNTSYILPAADGANGQILKTNGAGALGWVNDNAGAGAFTGTVNKAVVTNGSGALATSTTSDVELGYVAGVTSAIQTQLNAKQASGNYVTALTGDVTATGPGSVAATVAQVGGVTAANVATGANLANAATNANTASTIVKRDASGNFTAGTITATLNGTATNVTGTVAVANGGTGATTLGVNQLLFGNGTSAVGGLATTATPSILLSAVTTGAPTWTTSTAGNVLKGSVTGVEFGAIALADLPAGTLSGAGTINYVPYYNATNTLANSPLAVSGTSIGIGTATPASKLHISGASPFLTITDTNTGMNSEAGLFLEADGSSGGVSVLPSGFNNPVAWSDSLLIYSDTINSGGLRLHANAGKISFSTGSSPQIDRMIIESSGNVGIGTDTPNVSGLAATSKVLTIAGDGTTSSAAGVLELVNPRPNGSIASFDKVGSLSFMLPNNSGTGGANMSEILTQVDGSGGAGGYGSKMFFKTRLDNSGVAATSKMVIDNAGNVGIGTTAPGSKLDVKGTLRLSGSTSGYVGFAPAAAAGSTTYTLPSADGTAGQLLKTNGAGVLSWVTDSTGAGAFSGTVSRAVATDGSGALTTLTTTSTELDYVNGVTSSIQTQLNGKEPTITAGTTAQYLRGDKSLGTFLTDVMNSLLTGVSFATNSAIVAGDNLLVALGKLQAQVSGLVTSTANHLVKNGTDSISGTVNVTGTMNVTTGFLTITNPPSILTDAANKQYVDSFGQWLKSGSDIYRASGNVGIGTATPQSKLDVNGSIRVADDGVVCSVTTIGAIRTNTSTSLLESCDGTNWLSLNSDSAIPPNSVILMNSCPADWTDNGIIGGGQGNATCGGVACHFCQSPNSYQAVAANSIFLMESCPAKWSSLGTAIGNAAAGFSNILLTSCQSPAQTSALPLNSRILMNTCPSQWSDLGQTSLGQPSAICPSGQCHICQVPGNITGRSLLGDSGGTVMAGGNITLNGGAGGSTSGSGGAVNIYAGTPFDGAGGNILIVAGNGVTSTATARNGGSIILASGNGASNGNGADFFLNSGVGNGTGVNGNILLNGSGVGNVGIGTNTPASKLQVAGAITNTVSTFSGAFTCGTSTIDFSTSNFQRLSPSGAIAAGSCTTILSNMVAGGSYTLVVTGNGAINAVTYAFSGYTFKYLPANAATTAAKDSIYTFLYDGTTVYVTWTGGY